MLKIFGRAETQKTPCDVCGRPKIESTFPRTAKIRLGDLRFYLASKPGHELRVHDVSITAEIDRSTMDLKMDGNAVHICADCIVKALEGR